MLFHKGLFGYYDIFLNKNILTKQKLYDKVRISTWEGATYSVAVF